MQNKHPERQAAGIRPPASAKLRSGGQKALAFALMLTVPVALSGCNTSAYGNECDDYDSNGYCDDDGSRTYISNGKTYKKSPGYKSGSSSSKGFGSSGISSSGG
ncbi:hypothetical protein [Paenibacillus harenae]|uniref:hypothetical protein n=1 Tax=Paenibacillus harenae TaxID=306543 RepID=UPI00042568FB|nr:hypothetical protein [Paenibacillus harenae]